MFLSPSRGPEKVGVNQNDTPIRHKGSRNSRQPAKGRQTENERTQIKSGVNWQKALEQKGAKKGAG